MNSKVKICELVWEVIPVPKGSTFLFVDGEEAYGITNFARQIIYIQNTEITPRFMKRVCRHELCHAMLFSAGLRAESMDEEDICNFFEAYAPKMNKLTNEIYNIAKASSEKKYAYHQGKAYERRYA